MSLFKVREWWATHIGEEEDFDLGCVCVGNVDNSSNGADKLVVGSYHGFLRIYNPKPEKTENGWSGFSPKDVLCENQLSQPIIQVKCGRFVSGSDSIHIAVLHLRKLAVFSLVVTSGAVEHGTQYQLKLVYEHQLQRTAFNFCYGSFGGVKGKDFICVQSLDGTVSVFEQESFAFCRFLPGALLPGPICYVPKTDSFVTVSSSRQVESYKYQVLAVATETKTKEESQNVKSGKRVASEWTFSTGEQAIDIAVVSFDNAPLSIYVLGERNLFILTEIGKLRHVKKFEFNPSCFLPYSATPDGHINCMVATHTNTLMIYKDVTLQWAAQFSNVPVQICVANLHDLKGAMVSLDEQGHLMCSYLGTDPAMFTTPTAEVREIDYVELDDEMRRLTKVIKEQQHKSTIRLPSAKTDEEIAIIIDMPHDLDEHTHAIDVEYEEEESIPSITAKVCLKAKSHVSDIHVSLHIASPLFATETLTSFTTLEPSRPAEWHVTFFKRYPGMPATLGGEVTVNYQSASGASRIVHAPLRLPLKLVIKPVPPSKTAAFKVTIETNKPPVNLNDIYPDLLGENEGGPGNALGFQYYGTQDLVTLLASKTSQRYRLQCDRFENLWLMIDDLSKRLTSYMRSHGSRDFRISYDGPLPLNEFFEVLDAHFNCRQETWRISQLLEERAVQFRAIQRRLLTRFKDKTPAPLSNLDTLMNGTYTQLMHLADEMESSSIKEEQCANHLSGATRILNYLIRLWQDMSDAEFAVLEATLTPVVSNQCQQGWEEMVDASITHLLRTCLAKAAKDQTINPSPLTLLKDTQKLKKHVALLCDRLSKGAKLVVEGQQETPIPSSNSTEHIDPVPVAKPRNPTAKVPNLSSYSRGPADPGLSELPGSRFSEKKSSSKDLGLPAMNGQLPPVTGPGSKFMKKSSAVAAIPDLDDMDDDDDGAMRTELVYGADEL